MRTARFCKSVRHEAQALVDGVADPQQEERARAHCRACLSCAQTLHELTTVRKLVRSMPRQFPSARFDAALRGRLNTEADRLTRRVGLRTLAWRVGPVLAACCLAVGAYLAFRSSAPVTPANVSAPTGGLASERPDPQAPQDIYAYYASEDPLVDPARVDVEFGTAMARAFPELE